jgi:uracil phosphoribosyltransferase
VFKLSLVRLGRILGFEIIEDYEYEKLDVETPLGVSVRGLRVKDLDNTIIITVLRALGL